MSLGHEHGLVLIGLAVPMDVATYFTHLSAALWVVNLSLSLSLTCEQTSGLCDT